MQVIRTYDRGLGTPRKRPPRSKKLSTFLEIFEFEEDEEEEEDEEDVDDLERFSQALADEENAIREKEKVQVQPKKPVVSASKNAAVSTPTRGRGGGRGRGRAASHGSGLRQTPDAPGIIASPAVRGSRSRGRPPRGSKLSFRPKTENDIADFSDATKEASSEDDYGAYEDDDDYKPVSTRGRGRGRGRGQSRGKR